MMTDNYLNMKEILKFLIISSQIIYDHMEIIQYQPVFIYLFIISIRLAPLRACAAELI